MTRIKAAWRLRSAERGHLPPLAAVAFVAALTIALALVIGADGFVLLAFTASVALAALGLWLWGLWDEGGRLVTRTYRLRR